MVEPVKLSVAAEAAASPTTKRTPFYVSKVDAIPGRIWEKKGCILIGLLMTGFQRDRCFSRHVDQWQKKNSGLPVFVFNSSKTLSQLWWT